VAEPDGRSARCLRHDRKVADGLVYTWVGDQAAL
jgi:hypothetical protein